MKARVGWTSLCPVQPTCYDYWGMKAQDKPGMVELALRQERVAAARRMLADGFSIEVVAKYMGLSVEQVGGLQLSSDNV